MSHAVRIASLLEKAKGIGRKKKIEFVDSVEELTEEQLNDPDVIYLFLEI